MASTMSQVYPMGSGLSHARFETRFGVPALHNCNPGMPCPVAPPASRSNSMPMMPSYQSQHHNALIDPISTTVNVGVKRLPYRGKNGLRARIVPKLEYMSGYADS